MSHPIRMCLWSGPLGHWQCISRSVLSLASSGAESSRFSTSFAVTLSSTEGKKDSRFLKQEYCWRSWTRMSGLSSLFCHMWVMFIKHFLPWFPSARKGLVILYLWVFSYSFLLKTLSISSWFSSVGIVSAWFEHRGGWVFPLPRTLPYLLSSRKQSPRFLYLALVCMVVWFFFWGPINWFTLLTQ